MICWLIKACLKSVSRSLHVCVCEWLHCPSVARASGRHMPLWVTLQSKRTPTFCAHFSEIRASHCFRPCPAHKPRSPKNRHGVAMLFKTGSSPWEAGAQGTEYPLALNNLLFVLLLLVTAPTLPHFPAMGVSGANTSALGQMT